MSSVRILIADDHEVVRRGLRSLLQSRRDWDVCGEAVDGREAIEKAKQLKPDVVVLDVSMPNINGLDAARRIRKEVPSSEILILTQHESREMVRAAINAGARGYVAKSDISRDLLFAVEAVSQHKPLFSSKFEGAHSEAGSKIGSPVVAGAPHVPSTQPDRDCLSGGGEMGALMRSIDWSKTKLGPVECWPRSLKTSVSICLSSRFDLLIWWGSELIMLYNDAYRRTLASKHPAALGKPGSQVWHEIWNVVGPMLERVLKTGEATWSDDLLLLLERHGYPEETYHTFSYTPIRDESGGVGGIFTPVTETTEQVIGERRLRTLRDLAARSVDARSEPEVWRIAAKVLAENPYDVPFAVGYRFDDKGREATAAAHAGVAADHEFCPAAVSLGKSGCKIASLLVEVAASGKPLEVPETDKLGFDLPGGVWKVSPRQLILLPLSQTGQSRPLGVLVAGVSRRKLLDENYRTFFNLVAGQIAKSIADARAFEQERKRAEALAELDRQKNAFFSNVSHEFRTPLTLMLGPLEDTLARAARLPSEDREQLAVVHRNGVRLLKLVNTLLDFSRIEAGRAQAVYELTDLPVFTAELASVFRSAMDKAGLQFKVECNPLPEPVYVDRDMWEKIVLNLLSNAFKYTFEGEVCLTLKPVGERVELAVCDTGSGIPENELPHLFERFHRVQGARGRTYEGTGIGLALVQELARLHGGSVRAESIYRKGSTFVVSIPLGVVHLPADRIQVPRTQISTASGARAWVDEALAWLPHPENAAEASDELVGLEEQAAHAREGIDYPTSGGRILLADDNADMRDYVRRLLSPHYEVEAVTDGEAALAAARRKRPDLVLTDVMMPRLDGFDLIRELRADPVQSGTPILLLSARAGEESRVEGLQSGADDYLVKPFSARELMARISAHLQMARLRGQTEQAHHEHAEQYRRLFQHNPQPMWILDAETLRFLDVNQAAIRHYGYSRDEFLGMTIADIHPSHEVSKSMGTGTDLGANPHYGGTGKHVKKDGTTIDVEVTTEEEQFAGRKARLAIINDITERKQVEEVLHKAHEQLEERVERRTAELAESNRLLQAEIKRRIEAQNAIEQQTAILREQAQLLDLANDAIFIRRLDGTIAYWNEGAERLYGWTREEAMSRPLSQLLQTEFPGRLEEIKEVLFRNGTWEGELVHTRRDGTPINVVSRWTLWRDHQGQPFGWLQINTDNTEKKRAEESLRELSGRLLHLQDEERRRIARELHDSAGQMLVALDLNLSSIQQQAQAVNHKMAETVSDTSAIVQELSKELRTISYLLHPPLLDEAGLASALRWYIEGFSERSKIRVQLDLQTDLGRLSLELETTIFRIVQECLTNVHRHSGSSTANIHINRDSQNVTVEVRDQGAGMAGGDHQRSGHASPKSGVGIQGMRERVRQLGGGFQIRSGPGGTLISVILPISTPSSQSVSRAAEYAP